MAGVAYLFWGNQGGNGLQQVIQGLAGRNLNVNQMGTWLDAWLSSPTSQSQTNSRRRRKAQSKRPKRRMDSPPTIFDSFEAHRAYAERVRAQEARDNSANDGEEGGNLEQIYEQIQDTWAENGKWWWETLGRLAGFIEDEEEESTQGRRRTPSKQRTSSR